MIRLSYGSLCSGTAPTERVSNGIHVTATGEETYRSLDIASVLKADLAAETPSSRHDGVFELGILDMI